MILNRNVYKGYLLTYFMKTLNLTFDDKEFKKLHNAKEESKINGQCTNWEDFFYNLVILNNQKEVNNGN